MDINLRQKLLDIQFIDKDKKRTAIKELDFELKDKKINTNGNKI